MSWANDDYLEVRTLGNGERAAFSRRQIPAGTVVGLFDGRAVVFDRDAAGNTDFRDEDPNLLLHICLTPERLYAIAPIAYDEVSGPDFINHSCEPNCRVENGLAIRAIADIPAGVELTFDYRTIDLISLGVPCWCEDSRCIL